MAVLKGTREAVAASTVCRPARHVATLELDRAGRRPVEAAEHVHERRLAGAAHSDQAHDLARLQLERDGAKRFDPFEGARRSEEHTSELQSRPHLVCRLLLEKKKQ